MDLRFAIYLSVAISSLSFSPAQAQQIENGPEQAEQMADGTAQALQIVNGKYVICKFDGVSLSEALNQLAEQQTDYAIMFLYNELEDFRVTTPIHHKTLPDAIRQMIGFYPIRMTVDNTNPEGKKIFVECTHKTDRRLTGTIIDEQSQPVAFANITILNPADSTLLGGGVSNESGYFAIPSMQQDAILKISYIGYKTYWRRCDADSLGIIQLEPLPQTLKGVTVKGDLPKYRMTKSGYMSNVEGTVLADLGTAFDVLEQLPRVQVKDDKVSIIGRTGAPLIYINGRLMRDRNELRQLQSKDIKDIEVITNPGPQYASNVASVIRIRTRRRQGEGFSGSLSHYNRWTVKHTMFDYARLNYRKGNFDVFADFDYTNYYWQVDDHTLAEYTGNQHHINEEHDWTMKDRYQTYRVTTGMNYQIGDNHSVGVRFNEAVNPTEQYHYSNSTTSYLTDGQPSGTIDAHEREAYRSTQPTLDAYYQGRFGQLGVDFNGTWLRKNSVGTTWVEEHSREYGDQTVTTHSESHGTMWAAKLVMTYPFSDHWKTEFGSEFTDSRYTQQHENEEGIVRASDNRINERMIAGFAELEYNRSEWLFSLGARYEHNANDYYEQAILVPEQSRSEHHLLPTFNIVWRHGRWQHRLGMRTLAYRPSYSNLSSAVNYISHFRYQGGNPHLKTQYNYAFEYSLAWQWLNVALEYDYVRNSHTNFTTTYDDTSDLMFSTYMNVPRRGHVKLNISASLHFGPWYPQASIDLHRQFFDYRQFGITENLERLGVILKLNNLLRLPHDWNIRLNYEYSTSHAFQFVRSEPSQRLNFGIDKYFLQKRLLARLYMSDIFRTDHYNVALFNTRYQYSIKEYQQSRYFQLGIVYYFNSTKSKYKGTGAGNAEKNRL